MTELIKRWRRRENGKYFCDGDCQSWNIGICTCGLAHHVKMMDGGHKLVDWDAIQWRWSSEAIWYLTKIKLPVTRECPHGVCLNDECVTCNEWYKTYFEQLGRSGVFDEPKD